MNNALDCLLSAAQQLSAAGPIKQRLVTAYSMHLTRLNYDELPREQRDELQAIDTRLSSVTPLRGETAIQASVRKMSDREAASYALRIVNLLGALVRMQVAPRQPVLRAVGDE